MQYSQATADCQPTRGIEVDDWRTRAARLLWPTTCVLCRGAGQDGLDLCAACEADLPFNPIACARCANPLAADFAPVQLCGACLQRPPHFHASYAPLRYGYPVDHLIQGLKYRREATCGRVLGCLLARRLLLRLPDPPPQLIIPTPLSMRRYRERGFNQASELARPIQAVLGIPVRADLVVRARDTQEQTGLKQKERRSNIRGAFAMCKALPARRVAILDDVITTGSTANELAKVLRRAGATRVEVWAVARATYS
ncbi:MAG: ComF family protein [Steroidobacter sp.]